MSKNNSLKSNNISKVSGEQKIETSLFYSDSTSIKQTLEASLRSASLLELSSTISVDSNFIRDLKSIYQKTRFSVDIDTCVLFRFVNGLWWEVMPVIEAHKFIDNCRWTKVPKNQVNSIESLFEIRDEVVSHRESMGSNSDIYHLLSQGSVHFERFKTEHGGVAFKPSDSKVFSQYDSAFLAYIAAIISFCVDKDVSSHYLKDVYDSLQNIADKLNDDNQDENTISAILLDPVTGLHNKLGFLRVIQFLVDKKQSNSFVIVLSLEMSGGSINLLDEEVKSVFLKMAIVRLKAIIPDNNTLSILNSSEFAFIMIDSTQEEVIQTLSDVMDSFLNYLLVDGHPMACELRAGYSCYPSCESEPNELLRMAYIALYQAKNTPSRRAVGYQDEIVQELRLHLELAHCLPRAIEAQEFILYFQPIVKTTKLDEEIHHYEALIRWKHPTKGMIPPDRFIEIAEKSGDIIAIGYWVIHEVCRCLSLPTVSDDVGVSINLSPVQFKEERLVQNITSIVNEYGISPERITIEITETSAMQDNELTKEKFSEFHEEGFKLSMDDFGTGYSSLSYLLNFHFDIIKIDKSFIDNTLVDVQYEIIAQTVVKLAHDLSLVVVCEGIETDEQFKMVSEWKTDMIQGYLISKPKPWNEFYSN